MLRRILLNIKTLIYLLTLINTIILPFNALCQNKAKVVSSFVGTFLNNQDNKKERIFYLIGQLKCDSKNNVYISETHGPSIRKFTKDGEYIKTIGRYGQGPGEYKSIESIDIDKNDNLII